MTATMDNNKLHYKFLFLLSTVYLAIDLNVQGFLSLMPFIREEFQITRAQAGLYFTCYFLIATIIAIFSGRIADTIGSKKGTVFGIIAVGALFILHSFAPYFFLILILAFLTGLAFSIITPSLNKAVMDKVTRKNRATSMGIIQMGGSVGGFLGASLLPLLAENFGWRMGIVISGFLAIGVGLVISRFYREENSNRGQRNDAGYTRLTFSDSFKMLIQNRQLLIVCGLGLALGTSIGAIPAHYTMYVTQDLNTSRTIAGFSLGILQIGGMVGRPGWGWISDKFLHGSRIRGLILVGGSLALVTLLFSIFITRYNPSLLLIYISSFILGIIAMGWMGLFFTTVAELVSPTLTGIGTGFALVFTRTGAVISPPVFGYIADVYGSYSYSWMAMSLVVFILTLVFIVTSGQLTSRTPGKQPYDHESS